MHASGNGHDAAVKCLLQAKAQLDHADKVGLRLNDQHCTDIHPFSADIEEGLIRILICVKLVMQHFERLIL